MGVVGWADTPLLPRSPGAGLKELCKPARVPRDYPSRTRVFMAREWPQEAVPRPHGFRRDPSPPPGNDGRPGRAGLSSLRCCCQSCLPSRHKSRRFIPHLRGCRAENATPPLSPLLVVRGLERTMRRVRDRFKDPLPARVPRDGQLVRRSRSYRFSRAQMPRRNG